MIEIDIVLVLICFYSVYRTVKYLLKMETIHDTVEKIHTVEEQAALAHRFSERKAHLQEKQEEIRNFIKEE